MSEAVHLQFDIEPGGGLQIAAYVTKETKLRTVRRDVSVDRLAALCELYRSAIAHRSFAPENDPGTIALVKSLGKELYRLFFAGFEDILGAAERLTLRQGLFLLPLELAYDGEQFLGLRHAVENVLSGGQPRWRTSHPSFGRSRRAIGRADCLVFGDEDDSVLRCLNETRAEPHALKANDATQLMQWLDGSRLDIFHFAGHAAFDRQHAADAFFALRDDRGGTRLRCRDMSRMWDAPPKLVFLNSCSYGHVGTDYQQFVGLADELVQAGVENCVTTVWSITDAPAATFATLFYRGLHDGVSPAEALRRARVHCWASGESRLTSLSYVLFRRAMDHE